MIWIRFYGCLILSILLTNSTLLAKGGREENERDPIEEANVINAQLAKNKLLGETEYTFDFRGEYFNINSITAETKSYANELSQQCKDSLGFHIIVLISQPYLTIGTETEEELRALHLAHFQKVLENVKEDSVLVLGFFSAAYANEDSTVYEKIHFNYANTQDVSFDTSILDSLDFMAAAQAGDSRTNGDVRIDLEETEGVLQGMNGNVKIALDAVAGSLTIQGLFYFATMNENSEEIAKYDEDNSINVIKGTNNIELTIREIEAAQWDSHNIEWIETYYIPDGNFRWQIETIQEDGEKDFKFIEEADKDTKDLSCIIPIPLEEGEYKVRAVLLNGEEIIPQSDELPSTKINVYERLKITFQPILEGIYLTYGFDDGYRFEELLEPNLIQPEGYKGDYEVFDVEGIEEPYYIPWLSLNKGQEITLAYQVEPAVLPSDKIGFKAVQGKGKNLPSLDIISVDASTPNLLTISCDIVLSDIQDQNGNFDHNPYYIIAYNKDNEEQEFGKIRVLCKKPYTPKMRVVYVNTNPAYITDNLEEDGDPFGKIYRNELPIDDYRANMDDWILFLNKNAHNQFFVKWRVSFDYLNLAQIAKDSPKSENLYAYYQNYMKNNTLGDLASQFEPYILQEFLKKENYNSSSEKVKAFNNREYIVFFMDYEHPDFNGYASFPNSEEKAFIVHMYASSSVSTFAHELGHSLGLQHTFKSTDHEDQGSSRFSVEDFDFPENVTDDRKPSINTTNNFMDYYNYSIRAIFFSIQWRIVEFINDIKNPNK